MKTSAMVSLGLTTFLGGVTGYLTTVLAAGMPPGFQWKTAAIGAALAGVAALAHLYQDPAALPEPPKVPPTTVIPPDAP